MKMSSAKVWYDDPRPSVSEYRLCTNLMQRQSRHPPPPQIPNVGQQENCCIQGLAWTKPHFAKARLAHGSQPKQDGVQAA